MSKQRKSPNRKRVSPWAARRREDGAIRRALARRRVTDGEIFCPEIGRRIERGCRNELADILRKSYWMSKGEKVWKQVCRESLRLRLTTSWVWVVRRLGRG